MKDQIRNLIYSIAAGDSVQSEELFNDIMATKAAESVDNMQVAIAQTMFTPVEESEALDEISNKTVDSYFDKAHDEQQGYNAAKRAGRVNQTSYKDRSKGLDRAMKHMVKRSDESVEIDEISSVPPGPWVKNADGSMSRHTPGEGKGGKYDMGKVKINKEGHRLHGQEAHVFHRFDDGRINVQIPHRQASKSINLTLKKGEWSE
jgi:hypothetical protein